MAGRDSRPIRLPAERGRAGSDERRRSAPSKRSCRQPPGESRLAAPAGEERYGGDQPHPDHREAHRQGTQRKGRSAAAPWPRHSRPAEGALPSRSSPGRPRARPRWPVRGSVAGSHDGVERDGRQGLRHDCHGCGGSRDLHRRRRCRLRRQAIERQPQAPPGHDLRRVDERRDGEEQAAGGHHDRQRQRAGEQEAEAAGGDVEIEGLVSRVIRSRPEPRARRSGRRRPGGRKPRGRSSAASCGGRSIPSGGGPPATPSSARTIAAVA